MTEIEKMYENAGIKKVKDYYCPNCETKLEDWFGKHKEYICPNDRCDYALCDDEEDFQERLEHLSYREKYPQFTAEKQLELIKWLAKKDCVYRLTYERDFLWCSQLEWLSSFCYESFEESLANLINTLWQNLTDQEKEEIRRILNEKS